MTKHTVLLDDYGRNPGETLYGLPRRPYLRSTESSTVYECFSPDDLGKVAIYRKTVSGGVEKWEVGIGKWADRTSITYNPVNTQFVFESAD